MCSTECCTPPVGKMKPFFQLKGPSNSGKWYLKPRNPCGISWGSVQRDTMCQLKICIVEMRCSCSRSTACRMTMSLPLRSSKRKGTRICYLTSKLLTAMQYDTFIPSIKCCWFPRSIGGADSCPFSKIEYAFSPRQSKILKMFKSLQQAHRIL